MPSRRTSRPRATRRTDANQSELPLAAMKQEMVAAMNAALESSPGLQPAEAHEKPEDFLSPVPAAQPVEGGDAAGHSALMGSARLLPSATTARNPNGVGPFSGGFSDPPTQAELQAFAAYVEMLRAALVR